MHLVDYFWLEVLNSDVWLWLNVAEEFARAYEVALTTASAKELILQLVLEMRESDLQEIESKDPRRGCVHVSAIVCLQL